MIFFYLQWNKSSFFFKIMKDNDGFSIWVILKSPKSFIIIYLSIFLKRHTFGDFFFRWSVNVHNWLVKHWFIGMVQKSYQPISNINHNKFNLFFGLWRLKKNQTILSQNFNFCCCCKNYEKKGSFVACYTFFIPFWTKFHLLKMRNQPHFL